MTRIYYANYGEFVADRDRRQSNMNSLRDALCDINVDNVWRELANWSLEEHRLTVLSLSLKELQAESIHDKTRCKEDLAPKEKKLIQDRRRAAAWAKARDRRLQDLLQCVPTKLSRGDVECLCKSAIALTGRVSHLPPHLSKQQELKALRQVEDDLRERERRGTWARTTPPVSPHTPTMRSVIKIPTPVDLGRRNLENVAKATQDQKAARAASSRSSNGRPEAKGAFQRSLDELRGSRTHQTRGAGDKSCIPVEYYEKRRRDQQRRGTSRWMSLGHVPSSRSMEWKASSPPPPSYARSSEATRRDRASDQSDEGMRTPPPGRPDESREVEMFSPEAARHNGARPKTPKGNGGESTAPHRKFTTEKPSPESSRRRQKHGQLLMGESASRGEEIYTRDRLRSTDNDSPSSEDEPDPFSGVRGPYNWVNWWRDQKEGVPYWSREVASIAPKNYDEFARALSYSWDLLPATHGTWSCQRDERGIGDWCPVAPAAWQMWRYSHREEDSGKEPRCYYEAVKYARALTEIARASALQESREWDMDVPGCVREFKIKMCTGPGTTVLKDEAMGHVSCMGYGQRPAPEVGETKFARGLMLLTKKLLDRLIPGGTPPISNTGPAPTMSARPASPPPRQAAFANAMAKFRNSARGLGASVGRSAPTSTTESGSDSPLYSTTSEDGEETDATMVTLPSRPGASASDYEDAEGMGESSPARRAKFGDDSATVSIFSGMSGDEVTDECDNDDLSQDKEGARLAAP